MSNEEIYLEAVTCGQCGITFGVVSTRLASLRSSGDDFYCPNGHCRAYAKKPSAEEKRAKENKARLQRVLASAESDRDYWKRCAAAQKGALTRAKNRGK